MLWIWVLLALFASTIPSPIEEISSASLTADDFVLTPHVFSLTLQNGKARSTLRRATSKPRPRQLGPSIALDSVTRNENLVVDVGLGNQTFALIVDTTSSDTWVTSTDFECFTARTYLPVNQSQCSIESSYTPTSTFHLISDENFNITYSDGSTVAGLVGTEEVSLGWLTIANQTIGVVDDADWNGYGYTTGVLGLAYPHRTSVFNGPNPHTDEFHNRIIYDPLFTNMWKHLLVAPMFSFAINRPAPSVNDAGYFALGGVPSVPIWPPYVITPIVTALGWSAGDPVMYSINVEGITCQADNSTGNATLQTEILSNSSTYEAVLDTTAEDFYLPQTQAYLVNSQFQPPAKHDPFLGGWWVNCSAIPPILGLEISGQTYYINQRDLIKDNGDGSCMSTIRAVDYPQASGILGVRFYWNTLVLHDVGTGTIKLAARLY